MSKQLIPSSHIAITSCNEIAEIMLPIIEKHNIKVFNFYRMYADNTAIRLSSHEAWTRYYFQKNYLNVTTVPASYTSRRNNYFIWQIEDCPILLLDAYINFDIGNGISIARTNDLYTDFFCFGSTTSNRSIINNFYLNNLDLLQSYCDYFQDKSQIIVNVALQDKLIIADKLPSSESNPNTIMILNAEMNELVELTPQQSQCLKYLAQSKTIREIATIMKLSARTVEFYLSNIKKRLGCQNNKNLIIHFLKQI